MMFNNLNEALNNARSYISSRLTAKADCEMLQYALASIRKGYAGIEPDSSTALVYLVGAALPSTVKAMALQGNRSAEACEPLVRKLAKEWKLANGAIV